MSEFTGRLAKKHQYQQLILETYGKAVFISLQELRVLHESAPTWNVSINSVLQDLIKDDEETPSVAYVLAPGIATEPDYCCNGVRYGTESKYISFPNLPASVWNTL